MTDMTTSVPLIAARQADTSLRKLCTDLFRLVRHWRERARQRAQLADLDDHMLSDIGITRVDQRRECEKPFWR
jgi:uncharacterized protein YjiS (DUF1127 family)